MKWIFVPIIFLLPFNLHAQDDMSSSHPTKAVSNCMYKGWDISLAYFFGGPMNFSSSGADISITNLTFNKYYAPDFGIRYDYIRNDGFGFTFGGKYMFDRSLTHAKATSGGMSVTASGGNASISIALLEANVTYYLGSAYWYFGPNYSAPLLANGDGTTASGSVGGQIGLGWDWGNNISNIDFGSGRVNFEIYAQDVVFQFNNFISGSGADTVNWIGGGFKIGVNY